MVRTYGIQLHDLHHLGHEKTLGAALQLQHDTGLILSNVQVLQQFVKSLNRASSEVMRVAFGRAPFPADAMQQVVPSYRVRRVAHYMAAMGLWRPPSSQRVRGPLPSATCNACMSCSDCFPDLPYGRYEQYVSFVCDRHAIVRDSSCAGCIGSYCRDWTVNCCSLL